MWQSIFIGWIADNSGEIHFFGSWSACFQPVFSIKVHLQNLAPLCTRGQRWYTPGAMVMFFIDFDRKKWWLSMIKPRLSHDFLTSRRIRKPVVVWPTSAIAWWWIKAVTSHIWREKYHRFIPVIFMFTRAPRVLKLLVWTFPVPPGVLATRVLLHSWHVLRLGYWLVPLKLLDLTIRWVCGDSMMIFHV
jgi:hypothetical protein